MDTVRRNAAAFGKRLVLSAEDIPDTRPRPTLPNPGPAVAKMAAGRKKQRREGQKGESLARWPGGRKSAPQKSCMSLFLSLFGLRSAPEVPSSFLSQSSGANCAVRTSSLTWWITMESPLKVRNQPKEILPLSLQRFCRGTV